MAKTIDYYLSASSPWTYLGHPRFVAMAAKHGARINPRPVDFGRIFAVSGGLPLPQRPPQRRAYRDWELKRWKSYLNDPINLEPKFFPVAAAGAARLVIAAEPLGVDVQLRLAYAAMRAVFVEDLDIAAAQTLAALVAREHLPATLIEQAQTDAVRAKYDAYTQEAIERQVFGAPTYVIDAEPFWGQDRLDFVERALARG
ncbi:MAG: 2-hydroxychromene-2-carboxylate isomerase [Burkholderiales bacterium]|nr:2-hydroxychromene-2-carboxylate isomerase [Burkholderiales bacterium]